ncbi:MAG: hypothetical protein P4L98_05690 [Ancalomicrobiaceae bacterium]|nr:hypothetical protein [Ancalomicrobiaceae bacterium]
MSAVVTPKKNIYSKPAVVVGPKLGVITAKPASVSGQNPPA